MILLRKSKGIILPATALTVKVSNVALYYFLTQCVPSLAPFAGRGLYAYLTDTGAKVKKALLTFPGDAPEGNEIFGNTSFDTNINGWTNWSGGAGSWDNGSLKIIAGSSPGGSAVGMLAGLLPTTPGRPMKLRLKHKNTAGDVAGYFIYDWDNGGFVAAPLANFNSLPDSTDWSALQEISFTIPSGCYSIGIGLVGMTAGDIVWFDDVSLKSAAGTGETYGAEKIANPSFTTDTTGWLTERSTIASIAGGQSGNCLEITTVSGTSQGTYQTIANSTGDLLRCSVYAKSGTSGNETARYLISGVSATATTSATWAQIAFYATVAANTAPNLHKISATAGTMLFDESSAKKVLTPSTAGCWFTPISEDVGWNPNVAQTIEIRKS